MWTIMFNRNFAFGAWGSKTVEKIGTDFSFDWHEVSKSLLVGKVDYKYSLEREMILGSQGWDKSLIIHDQFEA